MKRSFTTSLFALLLGSPHAAPAVWEKLENCRILEHLR